ncbi:enoyl-CoA hydratase/isomerase family protein [Streptomyces sp. KM273126]|uniref:enoyl-CoA hydratase-related protein n=1 Tax=Streptomyces sp. KM273126 TaxID=2545247 RepID=UPI00103B4249|nr:enoyl-CoA hydratase-related protein [Streptomyces sp. KM273126]MBA2813847.1 enoyl-CoA hydratase/isomerase family protein [Streptomyces sp. KM273126]
MSSGVEFVKDGHVARVVLDRPEALNAITPQMDDALFDAWTEINDDPDIWVAVLSATGEKAFCAGGDVSGAAEGPSRRMALGGGLTGVGGPLLMLRKPLVAAVQGYVIGGGFELAMCADVIVAADTAQFGMPETKVGIIGEAGIMHRAIRQLPHHIALAMILTGERIPAAAAERYGLVNEVVGYPDLMEAADRWAQKIAAASPLAVQAAKEAVLSRVGWPLEVALATRYEPIEAYASTKDRLEGRAAFADRRAPRWQGR